MPEEFKFILKLSGSKTLCVNKIGCLSPLAEGVIVAKSRDEAMEEGRKRARKLFFMLHPVDGRTEYINFNPFISKFKWSLYRGCKILFSEYLLS